MDGGFMQKSDICADILHAKRRSRAFSRMLSWNNLYPHTEYQLSCMSKLWWVPVQRGTSKATGSQKADESGRVRGQRFDGLVEWGVGVGRDSCRLCWLLNYVESVVLDLLSACALISNFSSCYCCCCCCRGFCASSCCVFSRLEGFIKPRGNPTTLES